MPNTTEEYGKPPVKIDRPSKDSSFDDFFGTDDPKGNNLDQNKGKGTPSKTSRQEKGSSGDDFFGSDSPKGNSLGLNKGKSVPSNTNSQKKESSGDSFFDSDSVTKSKQKQHTKPSAKDDFFNS